MKEYLTNPRISPLEKVIGFILGLVVAFGIVAFFVWAVMIGWNYLFPAHRAEYLQVWVAIALITLFRNLLFRGKVVSLAKAEEARTVEAEKERIKAGSAVSAAPAMTPPTDTCEDCDSAARHAYSDSTTAGFFDPRCWKHKTPAPAVEDRDDAD